MELELIHWLKQRLASHPPNHAPAVRLGIGDDCAVLDFAVAECVATTDMLMDGTDFLVGQHDLARIGRKALAVNLSDIAAMAAEPVAALVSLALPSQNALEIAKALFEGMIPLAAQFGVAIVGGDTNCWSDRLVVSITVLARCPAGQALRRSGAQPGDAIVVTGSFGGSLQGKHFDFTPRVSEALLLRSRYSIHASCDVSDGLALDLSRIAEASGCGAVIVADQIPLSESMQAMRTGDPRSALRHALGDGEDFELILAVPAADSAQMLRDQPCAVPLARIGTFIADSGLWIEPSPGERQALEPLGYLHGRGNTGRGDA